MNRRCRSERCAAEREAAGEMLGRVVLKLRRANAQAATWKAVAYDLVNDDKQEAKRLYARKRDYFKERNEARRRREGSSKE